MSDLRFAVRHLVIRPWVTGTAIVTIALAIGANTAILSIADAVLFRPLPYAEADGLFILQMQGRTGTRYLRVPGPLFEALGSAAGVRQAARYASAPSLTISTDDGVQPLRTLQVSDNYFSTLGVVAARGRLFEAGEAKVASASRGILLTHATWRQHLAADENIVGRTVSFSGATYDVVGVLPEDFIFPQSSARADVVVLATSALTDAKQGTLAPIIRIAPDRTREQVEAELAALVSSGGIVGVEDRDSIPVLANVRETLFPAGRPMMIFLLIAAVSVLVIGCTNISSMLALGAKQRERETGISLALGVSRAHLIRQSLLEGTIVGLTGAALAVLVTRLSFGLLLGTVPAVAYGAARVGVDLRVASASLAAGLLAALLFSVAPIWHTTRADAMTLLRGAHQSRRLRRFGQPAIMVQIAAALVLAFGGIVATKSLVAVLNVPLGFESEHVVTISVYPRGIEAPALRDFFLRALEQVRASPEVIAAGAITAAPFSGATAYEPAFLRGQRVRSGGAMYVLPGYFEAVGIPLVRGRLPTNEDIRAGVAIVSETGARALLDPAQDPIGQFVERAGGQRVAVIGVVGDVTHRMGEEQPPFTYLMPIDRMPPVTLMAKMRSSSAETLRTLQRSVAALAPTTPVTTRWWSSEINSTSAFRTPKFQTFVLGSFAALSLVLSAIGIYAVVSFVTARRKREIGVRLAIGASSSAVAHLFVAQMLAPVSVGLIAGGVAMWWLSRAAHSQLTGIQPDDPAAALTATVTVLASALVAAYLPARRASRLDPLAVLRQE